MGESPRSRGIRRDALEVTTRVERRETVVFVCQFKADWLIAGDLNDYTEDEQGNLVEGNLEPLVRDDFCMHLVANLPNGVSWTHYFPAERSCRQLE